MTTRIGVMTLDGITYWLYRRTDGAIYPVNAGWFGK